MAQIPKIIQLEAPNGCNNFHKDVLLGMAQPQKNISDKYLYDDEGSRLFVEVCKTETYYPARLEIKLLNEIIPEIYEKVQTIECIVELGSGSSTKTKTILNHFLSQKDKLDYIPIDISDYIAESCDLLAKEYNNEGLSITGLIALYETAIQKINEINSKQKMVIFLGSSFANLTHEEGKVFMKFLHDNLNENDYILIGHDMEKDLQTMINAYNGPNMSRFVKNMITRMNQEMGGNLKPENFTHQSIYNKEAHRIEQKLISNIDQEVTVSGQKFQFKTGENIHIMVANKYIPEQIFELASFSGLTLDKQWYNEDKGFSMNLFKKQKQNVEDKLPF